MYASSVHVSKNRHWYGWSCTPTMSSPERSASMICVTVEAAFVASGTTKMPSVRSIRACHSSRVVMCESRSECARMYATGSTSSGQDLQSASSYSEDACHIASSIVSCCVVPTGSPRSLNLSRKKPSTLTSMNSAFTSGRGRPVPTPDRSPDSDWRFGAGASDDTSGTVQSHRVTQPASILDHVWRWPVTWPSRSGGAARVQCSTRSPGRAACEVRRRCSRRA